MFLILINLHFPEILLLFFLHWHILSNFVYTYSFWHNSFALSDFLFILH